MWLSDYTLVRRFNVCVFFFNDTATTEIYTLSLHDALPISGEGHVARVLGLPERLPLRVLHRVEHLRQVARLPELGVRSEEHTSELQSRQYLVCRLLLEKKKNLTN